jgi:hypothetical protein
VPGGHPASDSESKGKRRMKGAGSTIEYSSSAMLVNVNLWICQEFLVYSGLLLVVSLVSCMCMMRLSALVLHRAFHLEPSETRLIVDSAES